jgi:hypothetical protein
MLVEWDILKAGGKRIMRGREVKILNLGLKQGIPA